MLLKLDALLLRHIQKFCDCFQTLTGFTKYFVEKWAVLLSSFGFATGFLTFGFSIGPVWLGVCLASYITLHSMGAAWLVEQAERHFLRNGTVKSSLATSPRMRLALLLVLGLVLLTAVILDDVRELVLASAIGTFSAYVTSCIPRPPGKSKLRQWHERAISWARDLLAPTPNPIPIHAR